MADIENGSKKITDDAYSEKEKVTNEAKEKASAVIAEAEKRKKRILEEGKQNAGERYKEVYSMEVFKAKSGFNQKILLQKIDLVDQVIKKAKEKLAGAGKRDYEKLLGKILKSINIRKALYQIGTKENSIDDKMVKSVAVDMNLEESRKEVDFEKGLKIIDGKAEYRISAETFIEADLDDLKMDTAFFLFGKEQ